jgi:starvation-inducible DNA-binding protein
MKTVLEETNCDTEEIVSLINTLLIDEYALYTKTRNAHWYINGANYSELHKYFERQYEMLDLMIEGIAELVRALGHFALGSLNDFLRVTHMINENHDFNNEKKIIQSLINDHEDIVSNIRKDINPVLVKFKDLGIDGFLIKLITQHKKMSGMLKSYLKLTS